MQPVLHPSLQLPVQSLAQSSAQDVVQPVEQPALQVPVHSPVQVAEQLPLHSSLQVSEHPDLQLPVHELLQSVELFFEEPLHVSEQEFVQELLQSFEPVADPLHVLEHAVEQLLLHEAEHSEQIKSSESSFPHDVINIGPKATAPNIGNIPFAAFLKNSRLVWSSSCFTFFFIIVFILIVNISRMNAKGKGTKNGVATLMHFT